MAGKVSDDDDVLSEINVTPLVDIMLVLLIIFMLTNEEVSEKMNKAASAEMKPSKPLSIVISKDGKLFLNGTPLSEAELSTEAKKAAAENPGVEAILSADKRVSHGEVVRIIDQVRQANVEKVAINTKEQEIE
jgi:biopolymer transport protein ExbD